MVVSRLKKIIILIQNNTLYFSYRKQGPIREDLMNTNIISDSELVFTEDYILENQKLVTPFLEELCEMNKIDTITFQNNELADFLVFLFNKVKIYKIKIKKQENLTYSVCEKLLKIKSLKELECFSIPEYLLEMLDNKGIKVQTKNEIFYISPFMAKNNLKNYSKIYYTKKVTFYDNLTDEDKEDFKTFLKINRYLKVITLMRYDKETIDFIFTSLLDNHFKNIYIELHDNITNEEDYLFLKQMNKKYKKKNFKIGLYYSKEYLEDNLMKQIILNTLKLCGFIIVLFIVGMIGYVSLDNYYAMKDVAKINEHVKEQMSKEEVTIPEDKKEEGLVIKNKYIASLLTINKDVIGYLKVKNTNIDYPVVTSNDNKYYLTHNLYNEEDKNGWVYMDFRNSDKYLNDNTIIYGHNMYYSGVMFGTLHRTLNGNWYNNEDNLNITFDTMYASMNWKIYSIYTTPKTNDYLKVSFDTKEEKEQYINMTKKRSIKNFDTPVTAENKILTLSTCTGDNERLVIHAVLEENTEEQDSSSLDNVSLLDSEE